MTIQWCGDRRFRQDPKDPTFVANPYALYQELHKVGGPVYWEDYDLWCLTEYTAVDHALKNRQFARQPPPGHEPSAYASHLSDFAEVEQYSLLALEPPEHTRLRQQVNRAFVSRQVQKMASSIEQLANAAIDRFENNREVELLSAYATPIPVTVIAQLLGVPENYTDRLLQWSHAMVRVYTLTQTHEEEVAANRAAAEFRELLLELIAQRRRAPQDDLLSHMLGVGSADNALHDAEIVSVAILLLNAGHEATVHLLGNAVYTLLSHMQTPEVISALKSNADAMVTELMRFDAPLHLFTRYAQCEVTLHEGIIIPPGESIALLLGAANRDPSRFADSHRFLPSRTDGAQLSLGAGLHFCVGAALAKMELQIVVSTLFERLPTLALSELPTYQDSYHFHGLKHLQVNW